MINPLESNSFFLFGARGTGKSTYIEQQFLKPFAKGKYVVIDLLQSEQEDAYRSDPARIERFPPEIEWIFIDEVQKLPKLLDHVHRLLEKKKHKFILSGSSSRKLKRGGANLLAGRAFVEYLFPLTAGELAEDFDLLQVLHWGTLPGLFEFTSDEQREAYLRAYVQTYVREEILIEQLVRRADPFRDFLEIAGQMDGKILSYSKISREVGVDAKTVETYFQILEETYIGFRLPAFHKSIRKSALAHPKFYLFDAGVKRALQRTLKDRFSESSFAYGNAFESLVINEIYRLNHYLKQDYRLSFLRTKDGLEIDLILSRGRRTLLIEIKSYSRCNMEDVSRMVSVKRDIPGAQAYILSRDPQEQIQDGVVCLPWQQGLRRIFEA